MPNKFNLQASMIFLTVAALWVLWNASLWLRLGLKIGYLKPAPERLQKIVNDTAAKMNVTVRETWLLDFPLAQAFALPQTRRLLFSTRLLELVPDDELASICSHELAHLTESKGQYLKRYISLLAFLPWLLFKPMLHQFGVAGFFILLAITLFVPVVARKISHKLETRADEMAHVTETDPGVYARALARLHEDGLIPAVVARQHLTHPHLYDRLLAAGVTPDYPRPQPAGSMAWNGLVFAVGLGALAALLVIGKF
jgi:Zn-dependent protease with chaperone function